MRKLIACLVVVGAGLLSGCTGLLPDGTDLDPYTATFTATVVSQTKVAVDGRGSGAAKYTWDFGDGTIVTGGPAMAVASHAYADKDVYVIQLTCEWVATKAGGSNGGDCCGPPPGPGGGGGGAVVPGEPVIRTAYQVVDMLGGDGTLKPILITLNGWGGVASSFYPGQKVCLWAGESIGEGLWYQMEIVRVVSAQDPTPIPYSWDDYTEPEIRYIRTEQKQFCWYIGGPGNCSGEVWTFRVTLWISDSHGRRASTTKFIYSGCCP